MIITNTKIQTAIIKAWYSIALKSIKYYGGLAIGVNNSCLLKQIRLLRSYVDILKCFKIVGSTPTCNCHIEGDYTVELVNGLEVTNSPIQFGCNNQGYLVYNGTGYPFTYYYDSNNSLIQIDFTTIEEGITLQDIQFTNTCNITVGSSLSPLYTANVSVDNPSIDLEGFNGSITILNNLGASVYSLIIPNDIINTPVQVVDYWNIEEADSNVVLNYIGNEYVFLAPFNTNYTDWVARFSQFEGGSDGTLVFVDPVTQPFITSPTDSTATILPNLADFTGNGLITVRFDGDTIYSSNINYTIARFIENFNLSNTGGLSVALVGSNLVFSSPVGSGGQFNGEVLTINSSVSGSSVYTPSFSGGIDTTALFLYWEIVIDGITFIVYTDLDYVNYSSIEQFVDAFNNGENLGCTAVLEGDNIRINAPLNSFGMYDGARVRLAFQYESSQYTNYNETEFFNNAVDPELVSYLGTFDQTSELSDFTNNNQCSLDPIEQTCLSNKDVINIIKHIDRIV